MVYFVLDKMGFKGVEIVVVEIGWFYKGDDNEVGFSLDNVKVYNGNLIKYLRFMEGILLMFGKLVDIYFFVIYDEDLKFGLGFERLFGLFKFDFFMIYDIGFFKFII